MTGKQRQVAKVIVARRTSDGAGVRLYRSIGSPAQPELDPFLLLDEFSSDDAGDYVAGFPEHPHRGFETVTYMLAGRMRHEDGTGQGGSLGPGGVQWMTAGRGIVHSEMPEQSEGLMRGFQLWVNLPARLKMSPPRYQNLEAGEIPEVERPDGVRIRIIAGRAEGMDGAVTEIVVEPLYLDLTLPRGRVFEQAVAEGHNAFAYVVDGAARIGWGEEARLVTRFELAVLGDGDAVTIASAEAPARLLLVAARPLNEPVARYGPFVMNTFEEIEQAVRDYQSGRF